MNNDRQTETYLIESIDYVPGYLNDEWPFTRREEIDLVDDTRASIEDDAESGRC